MIASEKNAKVRYVQSLQTRRRIRQRERRFVLEGTRLVEEAVRANITPTLVFYTEDATADDRTSRLLGALQTTGAPTFAVSQAILNACADTETPQPILAVVPIPDLPHPHDPTLTLIVDAVRDPGNLGTMLRTALAAGVEQAILAPGTVDALNPKVVRAAMGAHFRLPIIALRWPAIADAVQGFKVWLAAAGGDVGYTEVDWTWPLALVIGAEAVGAGERAREIATGTVSIPMAPGVESLNTAIAAAVILFEIQRQRRPLHRRPARDHS